MKGTVINGSAVTTEGGEAYIQLYGFLEDQTPFIWKVDDPCVRAYAPASVDTTTVPGIRGREQGCRSIRNEELTRLDFTDQQALRDAEKSLPAGALMESDIEPVSRFLMENRIRGCVEFQAEGTYREGIIYFDTPTFKADRFPFKHTVLSFDIETDGGDGLYSISLYSPDGLSKVLMMADTEGTDDYIDYFTTEKSLIEAFIAETLRLNPHIIIGWYVVNFDFDFLIRKCEKLGIEFNLGLGGSPIDAFKIKNSRDLYVRMPGRVIIDGIQMVKALNVPVPNYKLNTVADTLLSDSKLITSNNDDKVQEIQDLFHNDKKALADYNLKDSILVYDIFRKLKAFQIFREKIRLTGIGLEKIFSHADVLDSLYLPMLHKRGFAAPSRSQSSAPLMKSSRSGKFTRGFYGNVLEFKYDSLAYDIIRTFRIDPLAMYIAEGEPDGSLSSPKGIPFHRNKNLLNGIIEKLEERKVKYSDKPVRTMAVDNILANISMALKSGYSRLSLSGIISSIERNTDFIMTETAKYIGEMGFSVIHLSGTSIFVNIMDQTNIEEKQREISAFVNVKWKKFINESFQTEPTFQLVPGRHFSRMYIGPDSLEGLTYRNNYIAYLQQEDGEVCYNGYNLDKANWCDLARDFQKQAADIIFQKHNPNELITETKKALQGGSLDEKLVFTRKVKKGTDNTALEKAPAYVQAMRKIPDFSGFTVSYVRTLDGPEPVGYIKNRIDYEYYLNKQLRPIAEAVLAATAYMESVDILTSNDNQLSFF